MGLWLKQDDGSLVPVGGGGSGGGGDAGPHDHDYLPLEGGTLTGALTVDKSLTLNSETSNPLMVVNTGGTRVGYFGVPGAQAGIDGELWLRGDKALILQGVDGVHVQQCDLQVDGTITARVGGSADAPSYGFADMPGAGMFAHKANNWLRFAVDGEPQLRIDTAKVSVWKDLRVDGTVTAKGDLQVDGGTEMRSNARSVRVFTGGAGNIAQLGFTSAGSETPAYGKLSGYEVWIQTGTTSDGLTTELKVGRGLSTFDGNVTVGGTINGQSVFGIAPDINTANVLDRAEVATMPVIDDEGVATADAESITVNEVVTALLAKVKELSARIETLEGV